MWKRYSLRFAILPPAVRILSLQRFPAKFSGKNIFRTIYDIMKKLTVIWKAIEVDMKILFIHEGKLNIRNWSGTTLSLYHSLKAEGFEVTSLALEDTLRTRLYKKVLYKLGRRRGDITRYPIFMKERQRKIVQALQNEKFDAIFAVGSIDAAAIPEDVGTPVYFYTDGTMAIMKGYYPSFSQWDSMTLRYAEKAEQKAVDVVKKWGGGTYL